MSKAAYSIAHRRLLKEYKELTTSPPEGITAGPISESNLFKWECLINGPESSPYESGLFNATLNFPSDYPMSPPVMQFKPPLHHPNSKK